MYLCGEILTIIYIAMLGKCNTDPVVRGSKAAMVRDMAIRSARHTMSTQKSINIRTGAPVTISNDKVSITW